MRTMLVTSKCWEMFEEEGGGRGRGGWGVKGRDQVMNWWRVEEDNAD